MPLQQSEIAKSVERNVRNQPYLKRPYPLSNAKVGFKNLLQGCKYVQATVMYSLAA